MSHIPGMGKSSISSINTADLLLALALKPGIRILDLGCGNASYLLLFYEYLNGEGRFSGMDLWEEGLQAMRAHAESRGMNPGLTLLQGDYTHPLPFDTDSFDLVFMSTVFHDIHRNGVYRGVLPEIHRVLAEEGRLAVQEFKPLAPPPGPPLEIRIPPAELDGYVTEFPFRRELSLSTGQFHYLNIYKKI